MTLSARAHQFARLHIKGNPLILFNIWDAGSARAVAQAGAKAIATGSWSVAAALGFEDGEAVPLDLALVNAKRIVAAVDLPVTIDFEAGYSHNPAEVAENARQLLETGAVGCNFEDQIMEADGLYSIADQSASIAAIRRVADEMKVPFFINARTDLFLQSDPAEHDRHLQEAISRASAYAGSGATGFFAPGLRKPEQIRELCERSPLPVNIMVLADTPANHELAALGVARISYGPAPYRQMASSLKLAAEQAFSTC